MVFSVEKKEPEMPSDSTTDLKLVKKYPRKFTWGRVIAFHHIGRYDFIEYEGRWNGKLSGTLSFHVYVDGESTSEGACTLEQALLVAIARGAPPCDHRAAPYAALVLGLPNEELPVEGGTKC
jgi:hypothetical protein